MDDTIYKVTIVDRNGMFYHHFCYTVVDDPEEAGDEIYLETTDGEDIYYNRNNIISRTIKELRLDDIEIEKAEKEEVTK